MRKDTKAKKAAKTEDRQVYERSLFPGIFDTTAQEAYMENTAAENVLFVQFLIEHTGNLRNVVIPLNERTDFSTKLIALLLIDFKPCQPYLPWQRGHLYSRFCKSN